MTERTAMKTKRICVEIGKAVKIAVLVFAIVSLSLAAAREGKQPADITPKSKAQELIVKMVPPITEEDKKTFWEGGKKSMEIYFSELREASGGRDEDVVLQLMYFSSLATSVEQGMVSGIIIEQMKISQTSIADAVLPLLDSKDETTRVLADKWLPGADYNLGGGVDFNRYETILREKKEYPPQGLIRYMYRRSPQAAVLAVARVYHPDVPEAEVAAKVKSGVKESVDYFAGRPEWWAHLYVAAMMEKEPYLRTPEMIKKLEQDPDPLVREKVSELKEKLQLK